MLNFMLGNKGAHIYYGNMEYNCIICCQSFTTPELRDSHICFECKLCQRKFKSRRTLDNHKCSFCSKCEKLFSSFQKLSNHKCLKQTSCKRISERGNVSEKEENFGKDKNEVDKETLSTCDILRRNELITDDVITRFLMLMSRQWIDINIGAKLPAEIEVMLKSHEQTHPCVPSDCHSVNIHYIDSHWITSWQDPCDFRIKVYDSLFFAPRLSRLLPILNMFYDLRIYTPVYVKSVTQQTESSCGAYACAFAVACANHTQPEHLKFADDSKMRAHLHKCIDSSSVWKFPLSMDKSNPSLCMDKHKQRHENILLLHEFENQQRMQTACRETRTTVTEMYHSLSSLSKDVKYSKGRTVAQEKERQRKAKKRAEETEEERNKRLQSSRERMQLLRQSKETEKMKLLRKEKDRIKHTQTRSSESVDEKKKRLTEVRENMQMNREVESDIIKTVRQGKDRIKHKETRSCENAEQKRRRLHQVRENMQKNRKVESENAKIFRQGKDRIKHKETRSSESIDEKRRRLHQVRENMQKNRKVESENAKIFRQGKDRVKHQATRSSESIDEKTGRQRKDRIKHKETRSRECFDEKRRRLNHVRANMQKNREVESAHAKTIRLGKERRRQTKKRLNENKEKRERRRLSDRSRKLSSRNPTSIMKAIKLFWKKILYSAEYVCTVCQRMLFKEMVLQLKPDNFPDLELLQSCRTCVKGPKGLEWICRTCQRHLKRSKMPPQAQANRMNVPTEANAVSELTDFEARLLAKRIPFMKITALPRGKQKGIVGSVINVPSDVDKTCDHLPRTPIASGIIPVKLKRKQIFKSHVFYENIRPSKVLQAFEWLKKNNQYYQDVVDVSGTWQSDSVKEDSELWDHLTKPKDSRGDTQLDGDVQNEEITEDDIDESPEVENEETKSQEIQDEDALRDIPLDTCIQSTDPALDVSQVLNFSPGEGKSPVSIMMDQGCEEMAFPKLFPKGEFGFDATRPVKITPKKYFNARILHRSGLFARNVEYLFFAQYITEHKQIMDNISIALRKSYSSTTEGNIDSSFVKDQDRLSGLILKDHAYQFLQTVRGSPPYWQKAMYKLLAAVKQFGIFTFFVTLSSADLKWTDTLQVIARQQGNILTDEQVNNMSYDEKCTLLRSNPVTAAKHFDHRLQTFFSTFLLSAANPLGKIKHYSYRIEFQQRGSPHAHIVLWIDNAPTPEDTNEIVCQFIDRYISCEIPDEDKDAELHSLVTSLLQHRHSATCKKKGTFCRFNFPKLPSKNTVIAKALEMDDPKKLAATKQKNLDVLCKIHEIISSKEGCPLTLNSLIRTAGVSSEDYEAAVKMSKYGNTVVLKRSPQEVNINYYNPDLLRAWRANIDVQYCLDPYACITYMVAYITKDEREMGQVLQAVSNEAVTENWSSKMRRCAKAFLNAREISAQEAVYRLLSLPLFKCSFRTVFVPADFPCNRIQLLKPISSIREMEDGNEDIFFKNIIDKYAARPMIIFDICLAKFAIWYVPVYDSKITDDDSDGEADGEADDAVIIELLNGCGKMKKATNPGVLRYHRKSKIKEPNSFFYSQMLLYLPWHNEENLLSLPSFEEFYNANLPQIDANRAEIEHYTCIIDNALEQLETNGPPTHIYDEISPITRQEDSECLEEGSSPDPDSAVLQPSEEQLADTCINTFNIPAAKPISYSIELQPGVLPDENYSALVRSLNEKQRNVYQHIQNWCTVVSRQHKTQIHPASIHLFVSGGAGTGKSHLISAIYQMAVRRLHREGENPDEIKVTLTAPTGTAAHNISGTTLHSAFLLPLGQTKSYTKLSDDKRNALRCKASNLKLLIIDEISMVGSDILLQIHHRLCEIKSSSEPFGGISVIVFGDLYQLPPVLQQFVFKQVSDPFVQLYGSLWSTFAFTELTQIMRQNEDLTFANLLNRVRTASHTDDDIMTLRSREISTSSMQYPHEILHVFSTNRAVNDHNCQMLNQLKTQRETLTAIDKKPVALKTYDVSQDSRFTGGLPTEITLAVGAKVMLMRNIDISDGLVNGAQGTVVGFLKRQSTVHVIFVEFITADVGKSARTKSKYVSQQRIFQSATPIERTEISFTVNKENKGLTISRSQFPLKLCWACTVHKVQGLTVSQIVISFRNRYADGQAYVALSRVKNLQGLHILDFQPSKIHANKDVIQEMERLRQKTFDDSDTFFTLNTDNSSITVSMLNTRSLVLHLEDVLQDPVFIFSEMIILTETWLSSTNISEKMFTSEYTVLRSDKPQLNINRQAGGVAVIAKNSNKPILLKSSSDSFLQIIAVSVRILSGSSINVIALYNSPNIRNSIEITISKVDNFLNHIETQNDYPTILLGDVNENWTPETPGKFQLFMATRGFQQQVKGPTHIAGSCLDHVYSKENIITEVNTRSCYYSDHDWVSSKIQTP